ncbi:hypothetical protein [Streptomyces sp. NPDC059753]|uniref:hypothetical protein n=1 Tax=Streptomyces sp. NPDC059753 TaxID=3346933 RepID=UPI0036468049
MHERVDRLKQARELIGRWQDRELGRPRGEIGQLSPLAGESLARWALENVLYTRKRPTPSFGFGLAPVLTRAVAAHRQRQVRGLALAGGAGVITARHPWGAGALVVAVLLYQYFLAAQRLRQLLRWGLSSLVSTVLLGVVVFVAWTQLRPYTAFLRFALQDAVSTAVFLAILVTVVYALDRWVSLAYLASLDERRGKIAKRPRLAPRAAAKVAECEMAEMWQSAPYRYEETYDRFVGAGLDARRSGATRIQLTPARRVSDEDADQRSSRNGTDHEPDLHAPDTAAQNVRTFEADELLDKVRDELEALRGVLLETHALPTCDVFETLAVPESRWKELPRSPSKSSTRSGPLEKARTAWPEVAEMIAEARDAPSGHASRRYLAAQVVDWKGHVVVTVFAHAALEGKTLNFVARPHVLAPLRPEATSVPARGWELLGKLVWVPMHAIGDAVELALRSYGILGRALHTLRTDPLGPPQRQAALALDQLKKGEGRPVSLREHCAHTTPQDMHQSEDAARYISTIQSRMFSTVLAFLDDHGAATGEFRRQVTEITQLVISGDNAQVNTGTVHGNQTQTTQQTGNTPTKG